MLLDKTLRLFLDGIGRRDEYEFYLDKFQSVDTACFALVCPDAESLEEAADVLVFDLEFLMRLEIRPALLLTGTGLPAAQPALAGHEQSCAWLDLDEPGSMDRLESWLREVANAKRIPVLATRQTLPAALSGLVPEVARRVHLVRTRGALHQPGHGVLQFFNTASENPVAVEPEDEATLGLGCEILDRWPGMHVSITSSMQLLEEMFTVKGAGTVLRRGRTIVRTSDPGAVDRERLLALLGQSFGKTLSNDGFLQQVSHYVVEESYRGAALLEDHAAGVYLTKFAVDQEARGEGLAQQLWREVEKEFPAMFWRARESNPINQWYERKADGRCRAGDWLIFWRGIDLQNVPVVLEYCMRRPSDFVDGLSDDKRDQ